MSIKRNFVYNFSYQILIMVIPLITTPYISRVIGPEGVGIQSYTISIANYFILFSMLGINNYGNRSIAISRNNKENLSKTFFSIYFIQLFMSILVIIIYCVYIFFIADRYRIFFLIQLIYIISSLLDINWFFFGMEEFKLSVLRNSIVKIASVITIFLFVKDSSDIYIYSLILASGNLISQLLLWTFIFKYINFIKVSMSDIFKHIKPILILFIPVVAISIYRIMDKIMIGSMNSITQVGFYENSEKIISIPMGVIVALGTVMLPKMSNLYVHGNNEEAKKYIEISMDFVMFMAIGAMFGLIGISPVIIPIFLDEKFSQCVYIVCLLSVTIIFLSWANVIRTQFLIPKKKDKIYIKSTILGAIINLVINLVLISKLGAIGAAIGTIFAEATVAIYQTIKVREELDIKIYFKKSVFYLIPGVVMCIAIRCIGNILGKSLKTAFIQFIIGSMIYLLISMIYMFLNKNILIISMFNKINKKLKL